MEQRAEGKEQGAEGKIMLDNECIIYFVFYPVSRNQHLESFLISTDQ